MAADDAQAADASSPAKLLRPSARSLLRVAIGSLLVCVSAALVGAVPLLLRAVLGTVVIRIGSTMILTSLGLAVLSYLAGRFLGFLEARAGYTTLPNRYRDLPQLDPRTRRIIREAGERYNPPYERLR
ncbi:hypothetical protein [Cryocola sp. 340MFSha3.1]|uniref:hypothetical protein n=1 Tax=Cryocola sp. 340MFSha3.1 TaxID=1169145 RepID=UPI001E4C57E8|nr:hypothetical protein [Cryocola sp. 340MFSha3.1]